jgi:hypothetical protein
VAADKPIQGDRRCIGSSLRTNASRAGASARALHRLRDGNAADTRHKRRCAAGPRGSGTADPPSRLESGGKTPETPKSIIIGDSLRAGMPLQDAFILLGPPGSTTVEQGRAPADNRIRMEYPAHGLVIATTQGLIVDAIEIQPAFTGQFASGVRIDDPVTALITAYGMPASMTPERAIYPDQGFVFTFDNAKLIGATVSLPGSRPPEKPAESSSKSLSEEKLSPPHEPDMTSPPSGSGKDPRKESGAQTPEQERTESTTKPAARQPQTEQVTGPPTGSEIMLLGGKIEAVLARDVTASTEPISPTSEFPEDTEKIHLVLTSELAMGGAIYARWIAVKVDGIQPNPRVGDSPLYLPPGQRGAIQLKAPQGGFSPGDYRIDLAVHNSPAQSLSFTVVLILPPAVLGEPTEVARGFNIALSALGGKVERAMSEYDGKTWAAANVIDGTVFIREGGWASKDNTLPQEFVFSFY